MSSTIDLSTPTSGVPQPGRIILGLEYEPGGNAKYKIVRGTGGGNVQTYSNYELKEVLLDYLQLRGSYLKLKDKKEDVKQIIDAMNQIWEIGRNRLLTALTDIPNIKRINIWQPLLKTKEFAEKEPAKPIEALAFAEPRKTDPKYEIRKSYFKFLMSGFDKKWQTPRFDSESFENDLKRWKDTSDTKQASELEYQRALKDWEEKRKKYKEEQEKSNQLVMKLKSDYNTKNSNESVEFYVQGILETSPFQFNFDKTISLEYRREGGTIVVDYLLPTIDTMRLVNEVKFVQTNNEIVEKEISDKERNQLFDSLIYQIALRTVYDVFSTDSIEAIETVVFNGWVETLDKSTGHQIKPCILSLQANKKEFTEIDLTQVDPKECFRALKGVGSSKLHTCTPIPPIIQISREDKRFIVGYSVAGQLDDRTNLAAMDWQDFENLIRELFEQEFSSNGGEVKITQASRDGGVDAVAFDPDPIRGGKIVIQAKRYTNTVGVSAVRDLYGTVINEGATKGILVSTSEYGPDAYEFVKGKPITLLNGGNLLSLLEKHGHRAKIDLKEAKKFLNEQKRMELQ
jgi:restriction system protein